MAQADKILANGTVVTMDDSYSIILEGAIAIRDSSIIDIGKASEVVNRYQAAEVVDCTDQVVIPGLINAHTHASMTLLRGLADDRRLDVWLIGYMMPTERQFVKPDFVRLGALLACAEMILSGVTTFNDMYYFEDSVAEATAEAGMRAICGQTVMKFPSPDAQSYEDSLSACRDFIVKWKGHPLIIPAVAPHAPYTATAEILATCAQLAVEFDVPLHIHLSETAFEVAESRQQHGMPVIPYVKKQNLFEAKVIAAHCVHIDDGEIHTLVHHRAGVAHNPTSNLKLASGIAPVKRMLELGLNVGIGTDGPASNNDLDMFEETRLAALMAKVASDNPTTLPARQAFAMATSMGARALHIGDLTGSLEVGKRADVTVVNLDRLHNWPHFSWDPDAIYSQLVYAAKSTDVQHVMCNGKWLMRDRELLTIQIDPLVNEAEKTASQIDSFLIAREGDILSRLLAIGELQREESFEIQVKVRLADAGRIDELIHNPGMSIVRTSHYRQHDTYFEFSAPTPGRVRYREDDYLDGNGNTTNVRSRLTLTEEGEQRELSGAILLSRSRYISPAMRTLRFYREYFQAQSEHTVIKERRRWHISYKDKLFYINLDRLTEPEQAGFYLEIKSRTWSLKDAEEKAHLILEMLDSLHVDPADIVLEEYVTLAKHNS